MAVPHRLWLCFLALFLVRWVKAEEPTCKVGQDGTCADQNTSAVFVGDKEGCRAKGFDPLVLGCGTCEKLGLHLKEAGQNDHTLVSECLGCCQATIHIEKFNMGHLLADASNQDRDQDLHDFIKRKAPQFPALEVEYMDGANTAIELSNEEDPNRVIRADVSGWTSDELVKFLKERFEAKDEEDGEAIATTERWTAEIQSCSGWRLNQLPEVRRFIKEPGHADTYKGLKVNFIPHHNPDLVFFNQHGEEKERLDLGRYNLQQIHELMEAKGFKKKKAKRFRGEIRTCSGWRLNQLPEVRRWVRGRGNADSYVGLRVNFIPHHNPEFIIYDEGGHETERMDISDHTYQGLEDLMKEHGFKKKELL